MSPLTTYLLSAMTAWVPLHAHKSVASEDETRERYESIAADLATVVQDDTEIPLFSGPNGRAQTALLALSVASFESGFRRDVDLGIGHRARGDHGRSWCLMQIHVGDGRTSDGWSGLDLVQDRKRCFRAGIRVLRSSMAICQHLPFADRLSAYVSGNCRTNLGSGRHRMLRAVQWWQSHAPPDTLVASR